LQLDRVDQRIVASLTDNARRSFAEVGAQVGLSAAAVKRRVDRLRQRGVIKGFTTVVDASAMGWAIEAFVEVFCDGRVQPAQIRAMVSDVPEVLEAFTVTGAADALLHVRAEDMSDFERVLEDVRDHDGISQTRSTVVLSRL
jgi:DNA-binding Lrp family transcriptional regulator